MALHCHYYVLSLGPQTSALFEAFRDQLVDIRNQGFPVTRPPGPGNDSSLEDLAREIDGCLAHHHRPDPLGVVVVGSTEFVAAFTAVTSHGRFIIGAVPGDHSATSPRDLGQIVWPVVKAAMSRQTQRALRSLTRAAAAGRVVRGLDAVAGRVRQGPRGVLLVEEGYHVRGGLARAGNASVVTPMVDVRNELDDAVDAVIGAALAAGSRVVFTPAGSLAQWERIALLVGKRGTA